MAKAKRKTLPKNFEELLEAGDVEAIKAVFDACDVNARGDYSKQTALAFNALQDGVARWLVEQGADIAAADTYGYTPLHTRASHWHGNLAILLELGADVHEVDRQDNTPLHKAAAVGNPANVLLLLEHGACVNAVNQREITPLGFALEQTSNATIERTAAIAELLLDIQRRQQTGDPVTWKMRDDVERIGADFEFSRSNFNPDSVDATSAALDKLYALFDVPPVPRRAMHDGKSPITATKATWQERHQELWALLVPASGAATTMQGEAIRVSGRIANELDGNGGINWDAGFNKMAAALLTYLGSGVPLPAEQLSEAGSIISEVKRRSGDPQRLCKLAVDWVALNSKPIALVAPAYKR
jgi:ankyrin repeat protein